MPPHLREQANKRKKSFSARLSKVGIDMNSVSMVPMSGGRRGTYTYQENSAWAKIRNEALPKNANQKNISSFCTKMSASAAAHHSPRHRHGAAAPRVSGMSTHDMIANDLRHIKESQEVRANYGQRASAVYARQTSRSVTTEEKQKVFHRVSIGEHPTVHGSSSPDKHSSPSCKKKLTYQVIKIN